MDSPDYLIAILKSELQHFEIKKLRLNVIDKRRQIRALMNLRPPVTASDNFLKAQDEELQKQLIEKGIVDIVNISSIPSDTRLKLWKGDITRLNADAIVNAANSGMLGCFVPLHGCIDNAIHSAAGVQLRLECNELIRTQGFPEPVGIAKITKAYNLPSKYVIHTVGPDVSNRNITNEDRQKLAQCYNSCLKVADENTITSIAFCCISTGEYGFPNRQAAEIAISTVRSYFAKYYASGIKTVIFNVFKDPDYAVYSELLI